MGLYRFVDAHMRVSSMGIGFLDWDSRSIRPFSFLMLMETASWQGLMFLDCAPPLKPMMM